MEITDGPSPLPAMTPRGRPLLAWAVIVLAVGFVVYRNAFAPSPKDENSGPEMSELQGRYVVGVAHLFNVRSEALIEAGMQGHESYSDQLRRAVIAGEALGPDAALERLRGLAQAPGASAHDQQLLTLLTKLYVSYANRDWQGRLSEQERAAVRAMGWTGQLALAPEHGPDATERSVVLARADRTVIAILGYGVLLLILGTTGLVLAVVMIVLWAQGRLHSRLGPPSAHSGTYAEAFAVYMALFFLLGLAARYISVPEKWMPMRSGIVALLSVAAVLWPVLRGVSWQQVRRDIGWTAGRRPLSEAFLGVPTYATSLVAAFAGLLLFLLFSSVRRRMGLSSPAPSHPIVEWVSGAGWLVWAQVAFVACVVAPFVEETMFRGLLYRQLRQATGRLRPAASALLSAFVVSVLFAAIHPQGLSFAPVLAGLAFVFALVREWRGSLVAPMTAHALTNGMSLLVLSVVFG